MSDVSTNPEIGVLLSYAPAEQRDAFGTALALDRMLAEVLRSTSEPVLGQIRLRWWYDALLALEDAPAPAVPLLADFERTFAGSAVRPAALAPMVDGWSLLIEEEAFDTAKLEEQGRLRGGTLFEVAGQLFGATASDPLIAAGTGWALADLARHVRDPALAQSAAERARVLLDQALSVRWSGRVRALGAAAHLARLDLAVPLDVPPPIGAPHRVARLLWHRLSGR
ncbi:squalene/phytoene synthase family protein [Sphingomonas sp. ac-8]|uniref:squalene/phytoene synthase family protein n=1 Tax=Sphingomonas sp. ac-8 TaxID=3242977 RepID=UPI003A80A41B